MRHIGGVKHAQELDVGIVGMLVAHGGLQRTATSNLETVGQAGSHVKQVLNAFLAGKTSNKAVKVFARVIVVNRLISCEFDRI